MIVMITVIIRISTIMTWPIIAMATVQTTTVITVLLVVIICYYYCSDYYLLFLSLNPKPYYYMTL